jgi:hypothetical protein
MTDKKECSQCGETKPLDDFPKHHKGVNGLDSWCRDCKNRGRKPTRNRIVRSRARQRAIAELVALHREEFDELLERHMVYVSDEFDVLQSTAKAQRRQDTDVPRLKPGPRRIEEQSIVDRLDVARCPHCVKHHDRGHRCEVCGARPGEPLRLPKDTRTRMVGGVNPAALAEFNAGTKRARTARRSS